MSVAVLGAGAFGTALAICLARDGTPVRLWARSADHAAEMASLRENTRRLPGVRLPAPLMVTADLGAALAETLLLAVPMQSLRPFLADHGPLLSGRRLVACCKGVDLETRQSPSEILRDGCPAAQVAILTGPSFAADIARGLPTALTLAAAEEGLGAALQTQLSVANLRLYRSTDVAGSEFGGALKNVIAIACGAAMGAGLGESARAALMTRGYAEMTRLALTRGGRADTLSGLSGFGDLALTCTSPQSRNYAYGHQIGAGGGFATEKTVEGASTAHAVAALSQKSGIEMPITQAVSAVLHQKVSVMDAVDALLRRPLRPE